MTDDYAGYNALAAQGVLERLGCWAHARHKFVEAQKVQPKGKTGPVSYTHLTLPTTPYV